MGAVTSIKQPWVNRELIGDGHKEQELAAFLPAALEIQQTPPHPLARKLGWALIILFVLVVVWACIGQVNIVASAEGKIIPSSRVKQIQPFSKAIVKAILVKEGEYVEQGQALIELDSTLTGADETRLTSELETSRMKLHANQLLVEQLSLPLKNQTPSPQLQFSEAVNSDLATAHDSISNTEALMQQQWQQYWSEFQGLKSSLDRNFAEQQAGKAIVQKLEQTVPIVEKRADIAKGLLKDSYFSEMDYLQLKQQLIQQKQDLKAEKQRQVQLIASGKELTQRLNSFVAQTKAQFLTETTELTRQVKSLEQELAKAADMNSRQVLHSPVAGQVQQLAVTTVGGIVTDAQQLMLVVPNEQKLEVEVFLANKDIGFVSDGMDAEIKVHTFPFTKYGVINGQIKSISDDAITDEQEGLIYSMQVAMDKNTIVAEGREVKLIPGMAVTAEIQTGRRRIIDFFLAPLLRHKRESFKER